ncbi:hypothetical protein [Tsuneonella amylolytica]|uniref:hypothetical protein n=1 Tax=Tsuneonella amylolytica TaxID=2338327 RepID=UPI000EAAC829|nr:hypothetical protein [Tsuneonella amylolytica]
MKKALYLVALLFCLFPYTQIIPLASYTQPYALVFSTMAAIVAIPLVQDKFPRGDLTALTILAMAGVLGFVVSCLPNPSPQDFKYLLIYVSPLVFAVAAFAVTLEDPKMADRVIVFAAGAWVLVGLIQTVISPSFMTQLVGEFSDAGEVVIESGRGTLGFAPEPTHFGFHMIILAALLALVGGRNLLALACLATAVLIARSSSAVLALSLGTIIYLAVFGRWGRWLLIAIVPLYFILGGILDSGLLPNDLRVVQLLKSFYEDPWYLITADTSANMRLGGIWVGLQESFERGFIPAGLNSAQWEAAVGPIMARNPWLIGLSPAGIASGLLIVVYQLGVLGLGLMIYLTVRMLRGLRSHFETFLLCSVVFVFMSQYMISTPGYGLILGVLAARRVLAERADLGQRLSAPTTPPNRALAVA